MPKRFFPVSWSGIVIAAVLSFSVLMLTKIAPYFSLERGLYFLSTKTDRVIGNPTFLTGFYIHITSSLWVMVAGALQFIPGAWASHPLLHRRLGKVYVLSILALAAPSGLVLAFYANGGLPAKAGFTLQCLVWWSTTYIGWQEARRRNWLAHTEWMIRSFAVTLAAISLRTESYLMSYYLGTRPIETYLTVTWLSWTGNLILAEYLLRLELAGKLLRRNAHKQPLSS